MTDPLSDETMEVDGIDLEPVPEAGAADVPRLPDPARTSNAG